MRRLEDERGAIAVLVAILMVALIGFAAIGVDVANMASDKQQLQNGADAAAFAIARECAAGDCPEDPKSTALTFSESNKNDNSVNLDYLDVDIEANSVTVVNGDDTEHWFAPVFGSPKKSPVRADATVVWGAVSGGATIPLTIDWCDFSTYMGGWKPGDDFPEESQTILLPKLPPNSAALPPELKACDGPFGGKELPGGFGWLFLNDEDAAACEVLTQEGATVYSSAGDAVPDNSCSAVFAAMQNQVVMVPIYDDWVLKDPTAPPGSGGKSYHIYGYAAFKLIGYFFTNKGGGDFSWNPPCSSPNQCIRGYFTGWSDSGADPDFGAVDLGAHAIKLVD